MTTLHGILLATLVLTLVAAVPNSLVYLSLAWWRSRRPQRAGSHTEQVRVESIWGMALALPALLYVLIGAVEPSPWSPQWLLFVTAVLALYAVAAFALADRRLPARARWYPAFVAFLATPALLVSVATSAGVDTRYFALVAVFVSRLGVGYIADCVVGVRFARAVGRRQAVDDSTTQSAPVVQHEKVGL